MVTRRKRKAEQGRRRGFPVLMWLALPVLVAAIGVGAFFALRSGGESSDGSTTTGRSSPTATAVAQLASDFSLPAVGGGTVSLSDFKGKEYVLLFFNEGIGCGGCWQQIPDLEQDAEFSALGVQLVSIMVDPLDQLAAEAAKWGITTPVLSDGDRSVSQAYDALTASMHPGIRPGHTFLLVDKDGSILWRRDWRGHGEAMYFEVKEIYTEVAKRLSGT